MKSLLVCALLILPAAVVAQTAESPPVALPPTAEQAPADAEIAPVVKTPIERPRPAVKPVPKPRPVAEAQNPEVPVRSAPVAAAKSAEPEKPPVPVPVVSTGGTAAPVAALGCWSLAFAMLIVGFAAGFFWRHQMSRRKLGGMSVRIGTWRGIP